MYGVSQNVCRCVLHFLSLLSTMYNLSWTKRHIIYIQSLDLEVVEGSRVGVAIRISKRERVRSRPSAFTISATLGPSYKQLNGMMYVLRSKYVLSSQ